jgi:PTS system nitrogen regulatory IIA component
MFPSNFIIAERIGCQLEIGSKKRVLEHLGELLATSTPGLSAEAVFDRLLERERLGSTGLGHGIALPHARTPEVNGAVGAFVQLQTGVDFDSVIDDRPVDLAFGLLVPQDANEEHLQLLAKLATLFNDEHFCQELRNAQSVQEILQRIEEWEAVPGGT